MAWWQRFKRQAPARRKSGAWWAPFAELLAATGRGGTSEEQALRIAAVYSCVRVISESLASLPLLLYKRRQDGGKERAQADPIFALLKWAPNPFQNAFEFIEMMVAHVLLRGNAYAQITRDLAGNIIELFPLDSRYMTVTRGAYGLVYTYAPPDGERRVYARKTVFDLPEILHVRGLSFDGLAGRSVLSDARETFGAARAAQAYGRHIWDNNATPGIVLSHPETLDDEVAKRLRESWEALHGGPENAGRVAILEEGMKVEKIGMTSTDAQYLETRKFQRSEIAALFRVPPHLIGDLERATFSNIEQQGIEFVVHTIRPWAVRFEQAIHAAMLSDSTQQSRTYFVEFLLDGLARGDQKSRYDAYQVGRQAGFLSANDCRALENMNPIPGGDTYLTPLNMAPAALSAGGK